MISAKIIAYSMSVTGQQIITWELEYPRFIHAELMTHRVFSRNAASSRAIPVATMIEVVRTSPAMPEHWGKNQPGMQANYELQEPERADVIAWWQSAANEAAFIAAKMDRLGAHKQIVNRILEPFQHMKTIVTATEFDNWYWLRNHPDAQPEIRVLAALMWEKLQSSVPEELSAGDWHVPYYNAGVWVPCFEVNQTGEEVATDQHGTTLADALAISASCCAQVSYRKLDDSLEKALAVFKRLVDSKPVHASPFEHQATPLRAEAGWDSDRPWYNGVNTLDARTWEKGITHADREGSLWSGNFKGWIQHRQLIPDNVCTNYTPDGDKE